MRQGERRKGTLLSSQSIHLSAIPTHPFEGRGGLESIRAETGREVQHTSQSQGLTFLSKSFQHTVFLCWTVLNVNGLVFKSFIRQWLKSFCTLAYNSWTWESSASITISLICLLSHSLSLVFVLFQSLSAHPRLLFSCRFCLLLSIKTGYFTFWVKLCFKKR